MFLVRMELFIDNQRADLDERSVVSVTLSVASVTDPEYGRTGYTKNVTIPMTAANRRLMGDCDQIAAADRFNFRRHAARIEHDGCVILDGDIRLTDCEKADGGGRYAFRIVGTGKKWADHAARNRLSTLFPDYAEMFGAGMIAQSWTSDAVVKWFPVHRLSRVAPALAVSDAVRVLRVLTTEDYHPFIRLRDVLHAIFEEAGYVLESRFIDGDYFGSLYMSGNYSERDVSRLRQRMDFRAARGEPAVAKADESGFVYADPLRTVNSVGNLVDTVQPIEGRAENLFDNGGCFAIEQGRAVFTPTETVSVGFEYRLRYLTDYRMESRSRLSGFDRVYLGGGRIYACNLTNPFPDRREEFKANKTFMWIVFGFVQGETYRLVAERTAGGVTEEVVLAQLASRTVQVAVTETGAYANLRVEKRVDATGEFVAYSGEWGLYDGYVAETGNMMVEVSLRSGREELSVGRPKYFDTLYFAGAAEGMSFCLVEATVRPIFLPHPTLGDRVTFAEVAAHDISRMEVVQAVREMFGLCFYTDELSHTVYAEPRRDFYRDDVVVDWSDRLDWSHPLKVADLRSDTPDTLTWEYRDGDTATADFNRRNGGRLGSWSISIGNPWQEGEAKRYVNTLFTPSVETDETGLSAASARLVAAGSETDDDGSLNFPAKVVRYAGMVGLPDGECWEWPSYGTDYPSIAFHNPDPAVGFTLGYADRDGRSGLHVWWDGVVDAYRDGVRLEAWIRLGTDDIETLSRPDGLMRDFRARFRLRIDGERSDWRLEEVCDYTPGAVSTKCVFTRIV